MPNGFIEIYCGIPSSMSRCTMKGVKPINFTVSEIMVMMRFLLAKKRLNTAWDIFSVIVRLLPLGSWQPAYNNYSCLHCETIILAVIRWAEFGQIRYIIYNLRISYILKVFALQAHDDINIEKLLSCFLLVLSIIEWRELRGDISRQNTNQDWSLPNLTNVQNQGPQPTMTVPYTDIFNGNDLSL